jgi:Phosphotransferase enzyme family
MRSESKIRGFTRSRNLERGQLAPDPGHHGDVAHGHRVGAHGGGDVVPWITLFLLVTATRMSASSRGSRSNSGGSFNGFFAETNRNPDRNTNHIWFTDYNRKKEHNYLLNNMSTKRSRWIENKIVPPAFHGHTSARVSSNKKPPPKLYAEHMRGMLRGRRGVGMGFCGVAYVVHVTPEFLTHAHQLIALSKHVLVDELPRVGADVIVKKGSGDDGLALHHIASSKQCLVNMPCIKEYAPKHFFSIIDGADTITVMSYAPGIPLKKTRATPRLYLAVERAVLAMWAAGLVHSDLHDANILVKENAPGRYPTVTIIDFGLAFPMSPSVWKAVLARLPDVLRGSEPPYAMWEETIQPSRVPGHPGVRGVLRETLRSSVKR